MTDKNKSEPEIVGGDNSGKSSLGLDENIAALLCYVAVFVSGIVLLILERQNLTVRFHALQSTVLFLALWIMILVAGLIPIVGFLLVPLLTLLAVVLWIVLMVTAYQKREIEIPIITDLVKSMLQK